LNFVVTRISESAKQKIEAAGGTVKILAAKRTPKQRVADLKAKSQ
jgi:ribosomal protein L18E